MTGADHYREAENILEDIQAGEIHADHINLALAQTHATLALAAAQAVNAYSPHGPDSQALFDAVTE